MPIDSLSLVEIGKDVSFPRQLFFVEMNKIHKLYDKALSGAGCFNPALHLWRRAQSVHVLIRVRPVDVWRGAVFPIDVVYRKAGFIAVEEAP